ncbi:MAG: ribosome maturation factor RimM [Clostridia bacterium]
MLTLTIGEIVKAQGIKGEVKVVPITDNVLRFKVLKRVFIDGNRELKVESFRIDGNIVFLKFVGINTRNDAELLANHLINVPRDEAVTLPEGSHFIVDLIGCKVICEGKQIGALVDVLQNGAADVYIMSSNGKTIMFPALSDLLISVDTNARVIEVCKSRFDEVAVYD